MAGFARTLLWAYLVSVYFTAHWGDATKCGGKTKRLVAQTMTQSIHSPGTGDPEQYYPDDSCTFRIETGDPGENHMLQIATAEFQLNDRNNDCQTDYVEVYEGDMATGKLVERWCGHKEYIYKTLSDTVTLHFKSDSLLQDTGFIIFFSVVEFASGQCAETADQPIMIGSFPLYQSFQGSLSMARCVWKIQASDPTQKLLFKTFKASKISCKDAMYNFYEGNSTTGHVSYQYCSTLNPFSKIYLNSAEAMLTFEPKESAKFDANDTLILKISAWSPIYACTALDRATIEVKKDPVIFPLPYYVDGSGSPCPVSLMNLDEDKFLRLDVMGTSKGEASCDSNLIDVSVSRRKKQVKKECNIATSTPVYRHTSSEGLKITPKTDILVYLRASTVPKVCSGVVNRKEAVEDLIIKDHIPSKDGYPNFAHCKYLISADKLGGMVSLNLTWDRTQEDEDLPGAPGDFITIYDGANAASAVLFSSKDNPEMLESGVLNIVSTQKDMLLILDSDARITGNAVHISYHSVPGGNYCPSTSQKIMLGRQFKYIMSPNYPDAVPVHQTCSYHLVPENPEDSIVVEVLEADAQTECNSTDLLTLYDGDLEDTSPTNVLGRVCGKDNHKFKHSKDVTLLATSGENAGSGGWKVKAYTQAKSSSQTNPSDGSTSHGPALGWILLLVFCVGFWGLI